MSLLEIPKYYIFPHTTIDKSSVVDFCIPSDYSKLNFQAYSNLWSTPTHNINIYISIYPQEKKYNTQLGRRHQINNMLPALNYLNN